MLYLWEQISAIVCWIVCLVKWLLPHTYIDKCMIIDQSSINKCASYNVSETVTLDKDTSSKQAHLKTVSLCGKVRIAELRS